MILSKSLISSIRASILTNKHIFPHKIEESWDSQFNQENPKINYLQKLLENNSIGSYFIQKQIKELQKQDIYFYMENKELFYKLPKQMKGQLIQNPNASAILKFHLAAQIKALKSQQIQKHLLESFNKSISTLKTTDLIFCLQIISDFQDASQNINYHEIQQRMVQQQKPQHFIELVYHISQFKYELQNINHELILKKIQMLEDFTLKNIINIKKIAQNYNLKLSPEIQNRLRQSFMSKRRQFQENQGQNVVLLLQYYPQSANFIDIECLNPQSYLSYLQFFNREIQQQTQIPKIIQHPIPINVINNAQTSEFSQIIQHRINLNIETPESLILNFKDFYTNNLNCIISIIRYLEKQQKINLEIQSIMEKSLINKIIKKGQKSLQQFRLVDVFKVLGYLSVKNLGTINFWKKSLKYVTSSIQDSNNYKNLSGDQQKKFVVYLFQIFTNKPFPRQLEDQIINLTLLSLTINKWSIRQILPLTISLKVNKIADNQLWFGIEQRINQINFRNISESDKKSLKKIIFNFNHISKGSFQFWNEMNKNLSKKQKSQILTHFKIPSTLAHTYFKL